jgi:hypothetical protein
MLASLERNGFEEIGSLRSKVFYIDIGALSREDSRVSLNGRRGSPVYPASPFS